MNNFLDTPIEYLKGIGPQRGDMLKKELQIFTYYDLLSLYPFRYVDRSKFYKIKDINEEEMEDEALFSKMTEEEIENELDKRKKVYYENLDKNYLKHHPPITVDVDKKTPNK